MDYEQQQKFEAMAAEQARCANGVGAAGTAYEPREETLRGRIHAQRRRAQIEARRAEQLSELEYLLDKNPDVARILELLEAVAK